MIIFTNPSLIYVRRRCPLNLQFNKFGVLLKYFKDKLDFQGFLLKRGGGGRGYKIFILFFTIKIFENTGGGLKIGFPWEFFIFIFQYMKQFFGEII